MEPKKVLKSHRLEKPSLLHFSEQLIEPGYVYIPMETIEVQPQTRRLRTTWTPELTQNLSVFHNIDAEAELTNMLTQEIAREIDEQIIQDLIRMGGHTIQNEDPLRPSRTYRQHYLVEPESNTPNMGYRNMLTLAQDLVPVQPMDLPMGGLFYFDINHDDIGEPTVLDSGAWYMDDTFQSYFVDFKIKRLDFTLN